MKTRKRIKKRRAALGITQYQLADKIGYSRSAVANWENGHRALFPEHIRVIARALHTRPGALQS
jgi:transcriptional regulator with XRE-family HTH domain